MNITTQFFFSNVMSYFGIKLWIFCVCTHLIWFWILDWLIDQSIDSLGSRKYISNWNISKRLWTESCQIKAKNLFQNKIKPLDYETTGNLSLDTAIWFINPNFVSKFSGFHTFWLKNSQIYTTMAKFCCSGSTDQCESSFFIL